MLNTLKVSFKIELYYAINSFIYMLRHTPILKEFTTDELYKKEGVKKKISYLAILWKIFQMVVAKFFYLGVIYGVLSFLFKSVSLALFLHTFFFFSIIGSIINYKVLSIGKKKYYAVILMGLDANEYVISHFLFQIIREFLLVLLTLSFLLIGIWKTSFLLILEISCLVVLLKIIGEAFHLFFYQKTKTLLVSRTFIYWMVLLVGLACAIGLPFLHLVLPIDVYSIIFAFTLLLAIPSFFYMIREKNYKLIYKSVYNELMLLNSNNSTAYQKQMMVDMRKKDYQIDSKKLIGKSGYDYFNTIFFLRHKVILSSSANLFSIVALLIFSAITATIILEPSFKKEVFDFLTTYFSWMILIMYFVNRGAIITQAMFYNCDRSMLTFPFYREKKVILKVFEQRLKTVIKVNLRPAFVIGTGYIAVLSICKGMFMKEYLFILLSILALSIFFSVHYLVIYYLLQPYNVHMEMKSFSFTIVSFLTYLGCYLCKDIKLSSLTFALVILLATGLYTLISLAVVYNKAEETFRLK